MRALILTPAARDWLAAAGPARVLNVFDRAGNLVDADGAVLSLVTAAAGRAPFSALVAAETPAPFAALTADSPVQREPGRLRLGALTVDWTAAEMWDPRPDWAAARRRWDPAALAALAEFAPPAAPPGSLLELFRAGPRPLWFAAAAIAAQELCAGLAQAQPDRALAGARGLAGLGGGLTPAGDDFILGVLLAQWAGLGAPGALDLAGRLAAEVAPRTATLSAAYVRAAARGECAAVWHDLLAADAAGWPAAARALLSIGHTSGADGLAGFLAASGAARLA